jgi:hypothetical protein
VQPEKFNAVRSTVNILFLKGNVARRKSAVPGVFNYAIPAWYKEKGIAFESAEK